MKSLIFVWNFLETIQLKLNNFDPVKYFFHKYVYTKVLLKIGN